MSYNGCEIFYQNLGDADSIYVRRWQNNVPTNILIDGGRKGHVGDVENFLSDREDDSAFCSPKIHHLVCTHSDDDHAGGLVPLVENGNFEIETAWVHDLRGTNFLPDNYRILLEGWGAKGLLDKIESSEQTRLALLSALEKRFIPHHDPYAGQVIGPLVVVGPTREFFQAQYSLLIQEAEAEKFNNGILKRRLLELAGEQFVANDEHSKGLGEGITTPINEVSTILLTPHENEKWCMFTGDVGPAGVDQVLGLKETEGLAFFDVPHHGSRRSLRQDQIDHLSPNRSFISAKGSIKHPSRKLVNALKKYGTVFSTHYSVSESSWLRHHFGTVPDMSITPATPLYDKDN
jgi:hypothetical protein